MFHHARRSVNGTSIPSWLKPGPIYVKRHVRNKDEPLVDEAELLDINPSCAQVRLTDGRETTVSIRDLSPRSVRDASSPNVPVPSPHYDIDILTTAVHQMKKPRKIPFLQTIRLQTTKLSLLQETMDITALLKHQRTLILQLCRCDVRHACANPSIDMGSSHITKMCYCMCPVTL